MNIQEALDQLNKAPSIREALVPYTHPLTVGERLTECCPVARYLSEVTGRSAHVGASYVADALEQPLTWRYRLPPRVIDFVETFKPTWQPYHPK